MNDLLGVLLRFRMRKIGLIWDLSKAYQSLKTSPVEKHLRRILWRDLNTDKPPDTYGVTCVTFGDRCAAA